MGERALEDPKLAYGTPEKLLARTDLTREQKRKVLELWELDARRLSGSEDENMGGGEPSMLGRVLLARRQLDGDDDGD
jgi:hypothetical protein